jgi:hypothetical protein
VGNLRTFNKTIIELIRGVGNVSLVFTDLSQLISDSFFPTISNVFQALGDIILKFFRSFANSSLLETALEGITNFGRDVIEVFRDIYVAVIGRSWWTDTINAVVDTSNTLWAKTRHGLVKFQKSVTDIFKSIFGQDRNFSIGGLDFAIPEISGASLFEGFKNAIDDAVTYLELNFPTVLTAIFAGLGGIAIALLFPASAIKTALLTGIGVSLIKAGALIADQLGHSLLDLSVLNEIALTAGTAVGTFLAAVLRDLPSTLSAILGVVSSFFRGVIEQIPLIGNLFKGVFNLGDIIGIAGPLGIAGALFFGSKVASGLGFLGLFKKPIKAIAKLITGIGLSIAGKGPGIISRMLFGPLGIARTLGLIGTVLSLLGTFDSLFENSPLGQLALQGGLLLLLFAPKNATGKLLDAVGKIMKPVIGGILARVGQSKIGKTIVETLFNSVKVGPNLPFLDRLFVLGRKGAIGLQKQVVSFAAPILQGGISFLSAFLMGKDPTLTARTIKNQFSDVFTAITHSIGDVIRLVSRSDIVGSLVGGVRKSRIVGFFADLTTHFSTFIHFARVRLGGLSGIASTFGGKNGVIGRMLFGRAGKFALVAAIVAIFSLFSSSAKASEEERDEAILDPTKDADNDISASMVITTGAVLATLVAFRTRVLAILLGILSPKLAEKWAAGNVKAINKVAVGFRTLLGGLGGAFLGGAIASRIAPEWEIFGTIIGALVGGAILNGIASALAGSFVAKIFTGILAAVGAFFTGVGALVAAAGLVVGGLIGAFLFGEGDTFGEKISDSFDKVKALFGFGHSEIKKIGKGISEEAEAFANFERLDIKFSLVGIDRSTLSDRENEKLTERLKELDEELLRARDREEITGFIDDDTRGAIDALVRGLEHFTNRLKDRGELNFEETTEALKAFSFFTPETVFGSIFNDVKQDFLDFSFALQHIIIKIRGFFGADEDALRKDLDARAGTDFNARHVGLRPEVENVLTLRDALGSTKGLEDDLKGRIDTSTADLLEALAAVRSIEVDFLGGFERLPADHPLLVGREAFEKRQRGGFKQFEAIEGLNDIVKRTTRNLEEGIKAKKRMEDVKTFQSALTKITSGLKGIGVSFDAKSLFLSDTDFVELQALAEAGRKNAKDRLAGVASSEELGQLNVAALRFKNQSEAILLNSELAGKNTQAAAVILLKRIGENIFSDDTVEALSDSVTRKIREIALLINAKEGQIKLDVELDTVSSQQRIATLKLSIQSLRDSIDTGVLREGGIGALEDVSEKFGVDFQAALSNVGLEGLRSELLKILKLAQDAVFLKGLGTTPLEELKEIEERVARLSRPQRGIAEILQGATALGGSFNIDDLLGVDANTLQGLKRVSDAFFEMNLKAKALGDSFTEGELRDFIEERARLIREVIEVENGLLLNNAKKQLDALASQGVETKLVEFLSDEQAQRLLDAERTVQSINLKLKDTTSAKTYRQLAADLVAAEQSVNNLFDKRKVTAARADFDLSTIDKFDQKESLTVIFKAFPLLKQFDDLITRLPLEGLKGLLREAIIFNEQVKLSTEGGTLFAGQEKRDASDVITDPFVDALNDIQFGVNSRDLASKVGIKIDEASFNLVNETNELYLRSLLEEIKAQADILDNGQISEEARIAAQRLLNAKSREFDVALERASKDLDQLSFEAGNKLVDGSLTGMSRAITDAVKGVEEDGENMWMTFVNTIVDSFTDNVIDAMVDGIIAALTDSALADQMRDVGANIFSTFFSLFSGGGSSITPAASAPGAGTPFARGGELVGAGTGTSDSMLVRASTGEFIVNAFATRNNRDLLEAINSNSLRSFARGGLVAGSPSSTSSKIAGNNDVFNINVTGDISRQTRAEIYRMLPEISKGVNTYNNEARIR